MVSVSFFTYLCFMDATLVQDNRLTSARYELTLLEKRILYVLIKKIRDRFVVKQTGNNTLFDDMVISTTSSELLKSLNETNATLVKNALKSLRQRSFEWQNEYPEDHKLHEWFEVGFINYGSWERGGNIEFQVSKKILPFLVELTHRFTEYSLVVAISLKSKWSQRFYELCCQWRNSGGRKIAVSELRNIFMLNDKYKKYASLKKNVIEVSYKELKELYRAGQSDVYFEYTELKNGRSVEVLQLKIISKDKDRQVAKDIDITHLVREQLYSIFEVEKKPKNKDKIQKLMSKLMLNPDQLYVVYGKIQYTKDNKPRSDWQRYLRAVFNSEYDLKNL